MFTTVADFGRVARENCSNFEQIPVARRKSERVRLIGATRFFGRHRADPAYSTVGYAGRTALYSLRKQTVEPVFGIIKRVMGWRQMSMRGLAKAQGEWSLVTMAWNIKRMHVLRAA